MHLALREVIAFVQRPEGSTGGEKKVLSALTINNDLPGRPRIDDARKVGVQFPLGIEVVLPMNLLEMREEVIRYVFVVVWSVTVGSDTVWGVETLDQPSHVLFLQTWHHKSRGLTTS